MDGAAETFGDELTLLGALQLRWHTRLAGHIERQLGDRPLDLENAVVLAWLDTADDLPGVHLIIDRHLAEPTSEEMACTLAGASAKEHEMLALMAGVVRPEGCRSRAVPAAPARPTPEGRARRLT